MTNEKAIMCLEDMKIKAPIPKAAKQARENNEALEVAIKALKNEPHWIPVTEGLPEEDGRYLVCGAKGGIYHANYRGRWWTQVGCGGKLVPSVVAWCELPEPYKGVTE